MDDLAAFMDPALTLPIGGHEFRVHCNAEQGIHLVKLMADLPRLDDKAERVEILYALGGTYQQMVDAGISWPKIALAGRTAMIWFGIGAKFGQIFWANGGAMPGNPLPPPPSQRVGDRVKSIFQRPEPTDRTILAAARTTL